MNISTQVAQTRVQEAQELIIDALEDIADSFDEQDLINAQNQWIHSIKNRYATNAAMINTFLFLDDWEHPADYFVSLIPTIKAITVEQVRAAVKRVLKKEKLSVIKVGPVVEEL